MNDMEEEDDDLSRFLEEEDDKVRPIDAGEEKASSAPQPETSEGDVGKKNEVPPFSESDLAGGDVPKPEFKDQAIKPEDDLVLSDDFMEDIERESERREELKSDGSNKRGRNSQSLSPEELEEKGFTLGAPKENPDEDEEDTVPAHLKAHDTKINYIKRGEYVDLQEKRPGLREITIGGGWDQRAFEEEPLDLDLSIFLLNKQDMTRDDGDFVFYNNTRACDGAVRHNFDSRSGAGDGDDETIDIDLNGIPFDILKVAIVISIYDPEFEGFHFGKVKNVFVRIVDRSDGLELFRYKLDEQEHIAQGNALIVGMLIREGPKWIFEADSSDTINGGLAKYATDYGIIVKELQSTGIGEDGATERSDD